jgi:hypothetical protein
MDYKSLVVIIILFALATEVWTSREFEMRLKNRMLKTIYYIPK